MHFINNCPGRPQPKTLPPGRGQHFVICSPRSRALRHFVKVSRTLANTLGSSPDRPFIIPDSRALLLEGHLRAASEPQSCGIILRGFLRSPENQGGKPGAGTHWYPVPQRKMLAAGTFRCALPPPSKLVSFGGDGEMAL